MTMLVRTFMRSPQRTGWSWAHAEIVVRFVRSLQHEFGGMSMSWTVEGTYFENCNCDFACPCTVTSFASPGTEDRCQVVLAYHIQRGEIDSVDVSGHSVAVVGDAPAKMLDGNWRVGLLIDDQASKEQADKLAGGFSGRMGGPKAAPAPPLSAGVRPQQDPLGMRGNRHQ